MKIKQDIISLVVIFFLMIMALVLPPIFSKIIYVSFSILSIIQLIIKQLDVREE